MKKNVLVTIILIGIIALFAKNDFIETKVGDWKIHIEPNPGSMAHSSKTIDGNEILEYWFDDFHLILYNNEVYGNSYYYGDLENGDFISLKNNELLINNKKQKAILASPEKIASFYTQSEISEEMLGNHLIRIFPGSEMAILEVEETDDNVSYKYQIRDKIIILEGENLTVNEENFILTDPNSTIFISEDYVFENDLLLEKSN